MSIAGGGDEEAALLAELDLRGDLLPLPRRRIACWPTSSPSLFRNQVAADASPWPAAEPHPMLAQLPRDMSAPWPATASSSADPDQRRDSGFVVTGNDVTRTSPPAEEGLKVNGVAVQDLFPSLRGTAPDLRQPGARRGRQEHRRQSRIADLVVTSNIVERALQD